MQKFLFTEMNARRETFNLIYFETKEQAKK